MAVSTGEWTVDSGQWMGWIGVRIFFEAVSWDGEVDYFNTVKLCQWLVKNTNHGGKVIFQ